AGQTLTLSYWAQVMAPAGNTFATTLTVKPYWIQNFGSGGSPSAGISGSIGSDSATSTWTQFTHTFTVSNIAGKTVGTASGQDYLAIQFIIPLPTLSAGIGLFI